MSRPSKHQMRSQVHLRAPDEEDMRTEGRTTVFAVTATVATSSRPAWRMRQPMPRATIRQKRRTVLLVPSNDTKSKASAMEVTAIPARVVNVDRSPSGVRLDVDLQPLSMPLRAPAGFPTREAERLRCGSHSVLPQRSRGRSMDFSLKDAQSSNWTCVQDCEYDRAGTDLRVSPARRPLE